MGEPTTPTAHAQPGTDNPPPKADTKKCRDCEQTKVVSPETWPYRSKSKGKPYKPHGLRCRDCETERKRQYELRRDQIVVAEAAEEAPAQPTKPGEKAVDPKPTRLDATKALKTGARALNEHAASVMARVLEYAEDPGHEHHLWALQLLAERVLPRKLFEELGGQAAGIGALQDKRPVYLIQVLPAQPGAHSGHTVEGEVLNVSSVPALPG
jgi:hypothetical protein